MKVLCSYSSITFTCEHMPGFLSSREYYHPIFAVPQKRLLAYSGKWSSGELTETDSYLLFLATLKSTDLVDFRVPAILSPKTSSIIAQNMEALMRVAIRLNTVTNPSVTFPHYVISQDTKDLDNVRYWIENWQDAHAEFTSGARKYIAGREEWQRLQSRESALERLIKNPHRPTSTYSKQIADWASIAGSFPTFQTQNPFHPSGQSTCADYWKTLIEHCAHETSMFSIPRKDLVELMEHCEENIPIGSIYSNALFGLLRKALERQRNFLGLGDLDIRASTYAFVGTDDSAEKANMQALIQAAPDHLPTPEEYPSKFQYMRAKLRWDMAQKSLASGG